MEISDLGGLRRPLTRLIEVVTRAIGRVSGPYFIRKNSDARAHEIRTIASAIGDVARAQSLSITYKEGVIEMVPIADSVSLDSSPISRRAEARLEHQEQKRQLNIESITSNAAVELMNDVDVPTDSPDDDWVTRFFESAQEVSSEKMQGLWSRILAGEIRRPGAFSLEPVSKPFHNNFQLARHLHEC